MGIFSKKTLSSKLIRQFGERNCGPNVLVLDDMLIRLGNLSASDLSNFPLTGADLRQMYPESEAGFEAAFDTALIQGRIDAVVTAQDVLGALAERQVSKFSAIPGNQTCGLALLSIQAATAVLVKDQVGSIFSDQDRQRASSPPYLVAKAQSFTQEHFEAAIRPWVTGFGSL
jgi:hypothetical protein